MAQDPLTHFTERDWAEMDAITWRLIGLVDAHRGCAACHRETACLPLREAVEAVGDWVFGRRLLSRAFSMGLLERQSPALDGALPEGLNSPPPMSNDSHATT